MAGVKSGSAWILAPSLHIHGLTHLRFLQSRVLSFFSSFLNFRASESPDLQLSRSPDSQRAKSPEIQISRSPNLRIQTLDYRTFRSSDSESRRSLYFRSSDLLSLRTFDLPIIRSPDLPISSSLRFVRFLPSCGRADLWGPWNLLPPGGVCQRGCPVRG